MFFHCLYDFVAFKTNFVLFTSTSSITQFLNSLVSPITFFTVTLSPWILAYIASLKRVFPLRIMLNSHIWIHLLKITFLVIRALRSATMK
jgi:hypothetical protein